MKWQNKAQKQQMQQEAAIQNEMMKDQMAYQGQQQNQLMQQQMAMQQGQEPQQSTPDMRPSPRQPEILRPPQQIQSPLTARSVQPIPPGTTGESLTGQMNVDLMLLGRQIADRINALDSIAKPRALAQLKARQPQLYDVVLGLMISGKPTQAANAAARPLSEQKPPRRGPEAQLI